MSIFLVVWLFYKIAICRFWNIAWSFSNKNENQIDIGWDLNLGWPNDLLIFLADQLIWFSWQKKVNSLVKSIVIPNKIKKRSVHYWDRVLKVKKILAASCINEVVSVYWLFDPLPLKKVTEKRWHHLWMTPKKNIAWLRCTTWPLHLALAIATKKLRFKIFKPKNIDINWDWMKRFATFVEGNDSHKLV